MRAVSVFLRFTFCMHRQACWIGRWRAVPLNDEPPAFVYLQKLKSGTEIPLPADRTLVLANLSKPLLDIIKEALSTSCGTVEAVHLPNPYRADGSRAGGAQLREAYAVFSEEGSVDKALRAETAAQLLSPAGDGLRKRPAAEEVSGLECWLREYRSGNVDNAQARQALRARMDRAIAEYDRAQAAARREREALAEEVDEDGFTRVVRRGRRVARAADGRAGHAVVRASDVRPRPLQGLTDFYRFQRLEARRARLQQLRERFQLDRMLSLSLSLSIHFSLLGPHLYMRALPSHVHFFSTGMQVNEFWH